MRPDGVSFGIIARMESTDGIQEGGITITRSIAGRARVPWPRVALEIALTTGLPAVRFRVGTHLEP